MDNKKQISLINIKGDLKKEKPNVEDIQFQEDTTVLPIPDIQHIGLDFDEQDLDDIVPRIVLNENEMDKQPKTAEDAGRNKWSHNQILTFLETLGKIFEEHNETGLDYVRRKVFIQVTKILHEKGIKHKLREVERKYHNMNMSYRRCRQRLLVDGHEPHWMYYKQFQVVRNKDKSLHSFPPDPPENQTLSTGTLPYIPINPSERHILPRPDASSERERPPKRLKRDKRKLSSLVQELVKMTRVAASEQAQARKRIREADQMELDSLEDLRKEIRTTRETVMQGFKAVRNSVEELTQMILAQR